MLIDELLPIWHFRERHRIATPAPAADLLAAVDQVTWGEVPVMRVLMRVRSAGRLRPGSDRTILEDMAPLGFTVLARNEEEVVAAAVGRPWSPAGGPAPLWTQQPDPARLFVDFSAPGWAKMIVNFRVSAGQLTTETRVQLTTTDRAAHSDATGLPSAFQAGSSAANGWLRLFGAPPGPTPDIINVPDWRGRVRPMQIRFSRTLAIGSRLDP